jgi:hypothetical protein
VKDVESKVIATVLLELVKVADAAETVISPASGPKAVKGILTVCVVEVATNTFDPVIVTVGSKVELIVNA